MKKAKILIVEDEAIIAMELERNLQNLGYEVISIVNTGEQAIGKAEIEKPDLILMDIRIQGEMDGFEAADTIKSRFDIPVVFSTAYLDEERIERAKISMPFGYILKPIQERDLKVTVEMALYVSKIDEDRKEAVDALKKSEHKLATHIRLTPMGVIEFDNQFNVMSWNPGAENIFGFTQEEVVGKSTFDILLPEYERESVKKVHLWENAKASKNINDNLTRDGRIITCEWFNTPMLDEHGNVVGLTAVCQDITVQIKAEQALEKRILALTRPLNSNQQIDFEALFNLVDIQQLQDDFSRATGVASVITQTDGTPITEPSNFCRLCQDIIRQTEKGQINCYKSDAELGRFNPAGPTIRRCLSGGLWDAGAAISVGGNHIANWLIGEVRDDTQNEAEMRAYAREIGADEEKVIKAFYEVPAMSLDQFKKVAQALYTIANQISTIAFQNVQQASLIAESKQAEAALKDSEEKYRTVIENANESIIILQNNEFKYFNPKTCELTGYSEEELKIKPFLEIVHPLDQDMITKKYIRRQSGDIIEETYIFRAVGKQNNVIWAEIKPVIVDWEGSPATLCFINDITKRKQSEELLIQTEKMNSVGQLAAGMAHELNNPLGGILQGIQNIERRLSPDIKPNHEPAKEFGIDLQNLQLYIKKRGIDSFFKGTKESGKKASQIISSMLQFSRKSESELSRTNLPELIDVALELVNKNFDLANRYDFKNINIIKKYDSDLSLVLANETEIEQVFLNLFNNAAWAMEHEKMGISPQIKISLKSEEDMVRIEVEDNGPGIDEDARKRIFDPFFTTKPTGEGTGLGLSVSFMIVTNNHKGTMEVESEKGKGAKFIIRLPKTL